jgi:hypothetical protein
LVSASTDQESLIPDSLLLIPDCKNSFASVSVETQAIPRKRARKDLSAHAWFTGWFCWASEQVTDSRYAFTKSDAGIIKGLLGTLDPGELLNRAVVYLLLTDEQRFPRGSPQLKGLASMINQIAGKDTDATDRRAVALGILQAPGTPLKSFTPWENNQVPVLQAA